MSFNSNDPEISREPLDTIQSSTNEIVAVPVLFETAFIKEAKQPANVSKMSLYGVTIGTLNIVSGRIIACDPMHIDEYGKPFTQLFPTGEFPVQLSIAKFDEEELIAFARIKFSDSPVVKWRFALLEGQSHLPLGKEKRHGYSVDASVGIFIDNEAYQALDYKSSVYDSDGTVYKEMDKHYRNDWRFAIYQFGNHNLAAFTTGEGDGYYSTYVGYDAHGNPCRLLTDFTVVDWK